MNILITTGIYPPDVGGPARFVPLIAEKLSNNIMSDADILWAVEKVNVTAVDPLVVEKALVRVVVVLIGCIS